MSTPLATAPALRVGVIGTGWGVKVQVPMFREAGLQVVALYSRDEKRVERLRKEMDVPHGFTDVGSLCECEEVDIVSLVCPTHLRKDFTLKAIHAGKHVLAEKPMVSGLP
jgi:predicted dehydrogenase